MSDMSQSRGTDSISNFLRDLDALRQEQDGIELSNTQIWRLAEKYAQHHVAEVFAGFEEAVEDGLDTLETYFAGEGHGASHWISNSSILSPDNSDNVFYSLHVSYDFSGEDNAILEVKFSSGDGQFFAYDFDSPEEIPEDETFEHGYTSLTLTREPEFKKSRLALRKKPTGRRTTNISMSRGLRYRPDKLDDIFALRAKLMSHYEMVVKNNLGHTGDLVDYNKGYASFIGVLMDLPGVVERDYKSMGDYRAKILARLLQTDD